MKLFEDILHQKDYSAEDLVVLLNSQGEEMTRLFSFAHQKRIEYAGNKVYLRGLVEFSNICSKNCLYCGIRSSNRLVVRYTATDDEILRACRFAWKQGYGSVVLQSGEVSSAGFTLRVGRLLEQIKKLSGNELGITLSCGEQSPDTYKRWYNSGAHRYLLRIEASGMELYNRIHPQDGKHTYAGRVLALRSLKEAGYQTGTGVMIGLPYQNTLDLAHDLLFFKGADIDMCGMGPYLEHEQTPLYRYRGMLKSKQERLELSLKMIACLRLLMPDINIAATTALQAIDPLGREKALNAGANVVMPNLTPCTYEKDYLLYDSKPCPGEDPLTGLILTGSSKSLAGCEIGYHEWGDSLHFHNRRKSRTGYSGEIFG